jgi:SNF2 family DNA or RNA helicase
VLPHSFEYIVQDLYGILAFLHLEPLSQRAVFRAAFERPIAIGDTTGLLKLKMLLATVAMRRLKTSTVGGRPLVELPPKVVEVVGVELTGRHREQYDAWEAAGQAVISQHLDANRLLQNYASVLEVILRCAFVSHCLASATGSYQ